MNRKMSFALALAAAAIAGCASQRTTMGGPPAMTPATPAIVAGAAPRGAAPVAAASRLTAAEQSLVAVAAGAGMYEVEAGRLAATRAADPQVKAYGRMLVEHHTANNDELMALVRAKGHTVAPGLPAPLQQKVTMLQGLSGPAFDREFIRHTGVSDHMAAIREFEQRRPSVADRDLQAYVDKTLPSLRTHLQQAQDLLGRLAG